MDFSSEDLTKRSEFLKKKTIKNKNQRSVIKLP